MSQGTTDIAGNGPFVAVEDIKPGMIIGSRVGQYPWRERVEVGVVREFDAEVSVRLSKDSTVNTLYPRGFRFALFVERPTCPHCGEYL